MVEEDMEGEGMSVGVLSPHFIRGERRGVLVCAMLYYSDFFQFKFFSSTFKTATQCRLD